MKFAQTLLINGNEIAYIAGASQTPIFILTWTIAKWQWFFPQIVCVLVDLPYTYCEERISFLQRFWNVSLIAKNELFCADYQVTPGIYTELEIL